MIGDWEQEAYNRILDAYESKLGIDLKADPYIYQEIIHVIGMLKSDTKFDPKRLREVVTNCIVLILSLFFNKDDDDLDQSRQLSVKEQDQIKSILQDAMDITSSAANGTA
jgi:hypothetical protein